MKILVTGANGYIGRHVVEELVSNGHNVVACDIKLEDINPLAQKVEFNLFGELKNVFDRLGKPEVCVHMAWRDGFVHNSKNHLGDLSYHYRFLSEMIDNGLKQLLVMGTMHEIGYWEGVVDENTPCNPISMYGIAKDALRRALIAYCNEKDCILQWLRAFYILGDDKRNHSIFTKILEAAERGDNQFPFTSGKTKYDFISVEELSHQISCAATQREVRGVINCCSGKPMSLAERVEQFISDNHIDIKLQYGTFPDRPYDSPCIYGDPIKINRILSK